MSLIAGAAPWVALIATCLAAVMTASNLGARVTGWGFVVFTGGALAWVIVGIVTGQPQLLYSNCFLAIVDIFGVWRWLGRQAHDDDVSTAEEARGEQHSRPRFSVAKLAGLPLRSSDDEVCGHAVDALIGCTGGQVDYLLVRVGGTGGRSETLRRLPWHLARIDGDAVTTSLARDAVERLPIAEGG